VEIRALQAEDIEQMVAMEEACFDDPWTVSDFASQLQLDSVDGLAAVEGNVLVGYVVYKSLRPGVRRVLNLAVKPGDAYRKHGIGTELVLFGLAGCEGRARVTERNLTAQLFLRKLGFRCTKQKRRVFGEDSALFFVKPATAGVKRFQQAASAPGGAGTPAG
jgi:ribosomal protein S18 acetylase RimI-like enzyme